MGGTRRERQARLKPEGADLHPSLPVLCWTSAARMEALVAAEPRRHGPRRTPDNGRRLSEDHFEFRGDAERSARASLSRAEAER